jgi:DNA-binding transcriptional LysR family regulator
VDPHLLRTFVAVARHGSFSAAARALGYTQSAVSQHIAALEADLRAPLLTRRPVAPTPAGARLLEHAGPLLLRLEAARADVTRLINAPRAARLTVGATPLAARSAALARALAEVRRAHPAARVAVRMLPRGEVPAGVATGRLDAGLVDGTVAPTDPLPLPDVGPVATRPLGEQPLAVVVPRDHPLARRPGLRLADLADARWLDAPEAAVPLGRLRAAGGAGGPDGFRPALRYEGTDPEVLLALAAAGHGLTVLPLPFAAGVATPLGAAVVPLTAPQLVHRTELLLPAAGPGDETGPAGALAAVLTAA